MATGKHRQKVCDLLKSLGFASTPKERRNLSFKELRKELRYVARARDEEYERLCEIYDRTSSWEPESHEILMSAFDFLKAEETYRLGCLQENRRKYCNNGNHLAPATARKLRGLQFYKV